MFIAFVLFFHFYMYKKLSSLARLGVSYDSHFPPLQLSALLCFFSFPHDCPVQLLRFRFVTLVPFIFVVLSAGLAWRTEASGCVTPASEDESSKQTLLLPSPD